MAIALVRPKYRRVAARLLREHVSRVEVEAGKIHLHYDHRVINDKVKIPHHVRWVGDWVKGRPVVRIHEDLTRNHKYAVLMAVHEAVERYVSLEYGFQEVREAHIIANNAEYDLARRMHVNWNNYGLWVEVIYRKEEARRGNR